MTQPQAPTPLGFSDGRLVPISVLRLQLAFYLVYPLHLAVIGALKASA